MAKLLWRARLGLPGTALFPRPGPARLPRLPLIARRDERELGDERARAWLMRQLRSCGKCRLYAEATRETSACYR